MSAGTPSPLSGSGAAQIGCRCARRMARAWRAAVDGAGDQGPAGGEKQAVASELLEYDACQAHGRQNMIASIREFFTQFIEPGSGQGQAAAEHALQVATAALLLEMMRMDDRITDEERTSIVSALRGQFDLESGQIETLIALAEKEARAASGYYQFTSLINTSCGAAQKIRIIENLWQVALADGHLDAHEEHLLRKIANLLYVGHADYIAAKQRARQVAGVPPAT